MFLSQLLRASIQDGILILMMLAGLKLLPAISPKIKAWLWRAVFVKLALSLIPFGAIPLHVLPPQATELSSYAVGGEGLSLMAPATGKNLDPWLCAWIAGFLVAGVFALLRYKSCAEAVQRATLSVNDSLLDSYRRLARASGIKRIPLLLVSRELATAVVVGAKSPAILLPQDTEESEDLQLVLAHEIAHVAHRDVEWNAFVSMVNCLFFFHPMVWLASRAFHQAQEAAADAAAIRLTNASPKRYGEMLVRATILGPSPTLSAGLSVGAPTGRIRKRLEELKYVNAKPTTKRIAAGLVLTALLISLTPAYQLASRPAPEAIVTVATPTAIIAQRPSASARPTKVKRSTHSRKAHRTTRPHAAHGVLVPATARVGVTTSVAPATAATAIGGVSVAVPQGVSVGYGSSNAPAAVAVAGEPVEQVEPTPASAIAASAPTSVSVGVGTAAAPTPASAVNVVGVTAQVRGSGAARATNIVSVRGRPITVSTNVRAAAGRNVTTTIDNTVNVSVARAARGIKRKVGQKVRVGVRTAVGSGIGSGSGHGEGAAASAGGGSAATGSGSSNGG